MDEAAFRMLGSPPFCQHSLHQQFDAQSGSNSPLSGAWERVVAFRIFSVNSINLMFIDEYRNLDTPRSGHLVLFFI